MEKKGSDKLGREAPRVLAHAMGLRSYPLPFFFPDIPSTTTFAKLHKDRKVHKQFSCGVVEPLGLNMQIMSLQLQKRFRFFPPFHFSLLSSPLIAASRPKLQVLA